MRTPGILRLTGALLVAAVVTSACHRSASAPPAWTSSSAGLTATPEPSRGIVLAACAPTTESSQTETVGPGGREFTFGPDRLLIPPGALARDVQVTVSKISRGVDGVDASGMGMEVPEVLQVPVLLTLSYAGCGIPAGQRPVVVQRLDDGTLRVPNSRQYVNPALQTVTVALEHLSDYMMASAT